MKKKIAFIDSVHPILQERLEEKNFQCDLLFETPAQKIPGIIHNYFGIVIRSRITLDRNFLDTATALRFIARSGSGLENIDVKYAGEKGIRIFNSPEGNRDAVAEHAIGMLLMLMNNLKRSNIEVRNGMWQREANRGHEIAGKTFAIIGYGQMGSALAEKLIGFGCKIIAHDKFKTGFSNSYVNEVSLEEIFEHADIVSLHLPLSDETKYYADEKFFSSFRKSVFFINTSRGKHANIESLLSALDSKKVLGACLDVLEFEKSSLEGLEEKPEVLKSLFARENVVLSPHIAGWTVESYEKLSSVLADKILAEFGGASPPPLGRGQG